MMKKTYHYSTLFLNLLKILSGWVFILFFNPLIGSASSVMGTDITYKQVDSFKYEIAITHFRTCAGIALGNPGALVLVCGNNANLTANIKGLMQKKSIKDVTPVCSSEPARCSNNQSSTGDGIEAHTWTVLLDLDSSAFANFKNCGKLRIQFSNCCRPSNITTGAGNSNLFTFAELYLSNEWNSSPIFTSEPNNLLCCNQPYFTNIGAVDTLEFDSLSFHWGQVLTSMGQNVTFTGQNLNFDHPFTAYYPGSLGPPLALPNGFRDRGNPVGIYLDTKNGDVVFTPTSCGERTVAVIEVKEWRKIPKVLSNGTTVYETVQLGTTRRELQYMINNCPRNFPPNVVIEKNSFEICENDNFCFSISSDDRQYIDPVTGTKGKLDSVTLSWNEVIPGATFSIVKDTARLQEARFCWTPNRGQSKDQPYTFIISARDNACPLNSFDRKSIKVKVNPEAKTVRSYENLSCGLLAIKSELVDSNQSFKNITWSVTDLSGKKISNRPPIFQSSNGVVSSKSVDTLQFNEPGKYLIIHSANSCFENIDTVDIAPFFQMQLSYGADTFACENTPIFLSPILNNEVSPLTFQWGITAIGNSGQIDVSNTTFNPKDTFADFEVVLNQNTTKIGVGLIIKDGSGCESTEFILVNKLFNPSVTIPSVPAICNGDNTTVQVGFYNPQDGMLQVTWLFDDEELITTDKDKITASKAGMYTVRIEDVAGCRGIGSFELEINDAIRAFTKSDLVYCKGEQITLIPEGLDTIENDKTGLYKWFDVSHATPVELSASGALTLTALQNMKFLLELMVTQNNVTCTTRETFDIQVNDLPEVVLPAGDLVIECLSYTLPKLSIGNYFTLEGGQGTKLEEGHEITASQVLYVFANENNCSVEKSFEIVIRDLPEVDMLENVTSCETFVLPTLRRGSYFDQPDGQGNLLSAGDQIQQNAKLYIFNRNSCGTNERAFDIAIVPNPSNDVSVSENTLTANEADASYQWLDCKQNKDPISGAIFQSYTPSQSAELAVEVSKNGCTVTSDCINLVHSNIELKQIEKIELYPNPNSGRFVVNLGTLRNVKITIYDMNGKVVYLEEDIEESLKNIEIKGAAGVYQMEIEAEGERRMFKVVKEN